MKGKIERHGATTPNPREPLKVTFCANFSDPLTCSMLPSSAWSSKVVDDTEHWGDNAAIRLSVCLSSSSTSYSYGCYRTPTGNVMQPEVAETPTKLWPATLQNHSLGGCTTIFLTLALYKSHNYLLTYCPDCKGQQRYPTVAVWAANSQHWHGIRRQTACLRSGHIVSPPSGTYLNCLHLLRICVLHNSRNKS